MLLKIAASNNARKSAVMRPIILPISFYYSVRLFALVGFGIGTAIGLFLGIPFIGALLIGVPMAGCLAVAHWLDTEMYWRAREQSFHEKLTRARQSGRWPGL